MRKVLLVVVCATLTDAQHEWVYVVFDASRRPILDT
jgi:hypothetical protein